MVTSAEVVTNKPLSGLELREIMRQDFEALLQSHGLLSEYIAYGRIAYDIVIALHVDNAMQPNEGRISMRSKRQPREAVAEKPALSAIEPPPLSAPSPEAVVDAVKLTRTIVSPNSERLRVGIPVPVETRQQDGSKLTHNVKYPKQDSELCQSTETNVSAEKRAEWKQPEPPQVQMADPEIAKVDPT